MILILIAIYFFISEILCLSVLFEKREDFIAMTITLGDMFIAMLIAPIVAPIIILDKLGNIPLKKI